METATANGGDSGDSSYHDNVDFKFGCKENGLAHQAHHKHVSNTRNGVSEEVESDTLPVWVGESGVWVSVKIVADAEDNGHTVDESS